MKPKPTLRAIDSNIRRAEACLRRTEYLEASWIYDRLRGDCVGRGLGEISTIRYYWDQRAKLYGEMAAYCRLLAHPVDGGGEATGLTPARPPEAPAPWGHTIDRMLHDLEARRD